MLAAARTVSVTRAQRHAFDLEAAQVGPEAMAEARRQLGDEREARRRCTICGDCEPVAAYGGWCCAKAMKLTHASEQSSSEVAP
jgi:hypothetical protein